MGVAKHTIHLECLMFFFSRWLRECGSIIMLPSAHPWFPLIRTPRSLTVCFSARMVHRANTKICASTAGCVCLGDKHGIGDLGNITSRLGTIFLQILSHFCLDICACLPPPLRPPLLGGCHVWNQRLTRNARHSPFYILQSPQVLQ